MKRDMELIRKILFYIEENYIPGERWLQDINISGYNQATIMEHILLVHEAGFIQNIKDVSTMSGTEYWVSNLSSAGYDFLDKIRNDTIWNKTKETIKEKGLPMLITTIGTVASAFVSAATEGAVAALLKSGGLPDGN